jgi:nitrogen-specific signal transduction histidine kinase/CheY-like chemotaxis protein
MTDDAQSELASLSRDELVARARALQTVLRVVRDVATARSLAEVASRFVDAVTAYTRFPSLVVWRAQPSGDGFDLLAQRGFDETRFPRDTILPRKGSLTGLAVDRRQVMTTDDIATDERVDPGMRAALSASAYASGACVPILCGDDALGCFNVVCPRGTTLAADERTFLEALAASLGVAMAQQIAAHRQRELEAQAIRAQQIESLGVLASGIAHDFNNLLTGIVGNIDLARDRTSTGQDTELAEILSDALTAAGRANRLVNQLLTFSRGGAPSLRVTRDLGGLIAEVSSFAARGTSVRLVIDMEEPLGVVEIDAGQIGQVFQNLVLNACQASARGSTLTIRGRRVLKNGEASVLIEVIDQGTGIADDQLPHIFEPFFTGRAGGTGLGLAVSQSIVRRHGGQLSVKSAVGGGSTFAVELPVSRRAVLRQPEPIAGLARFSGRALVLDDEEAIKNVASLLLGRLGFEVQSSGDGDEALDLARRAVVEERPFRVAVLDLTIVGGRGGAEIAEELRRASPGIHLIASSGYASVEKLAGWDATLPKPYSLADLSAALERTLRRP